MTTKRLFPEELLSDTSEARLSYFKNLVVMHSKLENAIKDVLRYINNPAGFSLLLVSGPSGAGKTKLCNEVVDLFLGQQLHLESDVGSIPIAMLELAAPDSGIFNWKDYYIRALEALREPLIDRKVDYDRLINGTDKKEKPRISDPRTSPELRRSLENAFMYRKTKAFIVDEAQHYTKVIGSRKLQDQLDVIKSISNCTSVTHVLVGTYELRNLININEQLSRRTKEIHFGRYRADKTDECIEFKNIICNFQKSLPLEIEPNLVQHWDFIYERTAGCVGILKDWLVRCLDNALNENLKTINLNTLKQNALSTDKIKKIITEIKAGEKRFTDSKDKLNDMRIALGLNGKKNNETKLEKTQHKVKNVGERNPKRDIVGTNDIQ